MPAKIAFSGDNAKFMRLDFVFPSCVSMSKSERDYEYSEEGVMGINISLSGLCPIAILSVPEWHRHNEAR